MAREKALWCWGLVWFTLLLKETVLSDQLQNNSCNPRCGIITNISSPFRQQGDPPNCGDPKYELACENNITLLRLYSGTYRVVGINYNNYTIRLVDPGIHKGDCSSLPRYFLSQSNFSYFGDFSDSDSESELVFKHVVYLKCRDPVRDDAVYVDTSPCVNWESKREGDGEGYVYAVAGDLLGKDLKSGCRVKLVATISSYWDSLIPGGVTSYADIHRVLSYGFEVSWKTWFFRGCKALQCDDVCSFDRNAQTFQCRQSPPTNCNSPMAIDNVGCPPLPKLRIFAEDYIYGVYKGFRQIVKMRTYRHYKDYDFSLTNLAITLGIATGRIVLPVITTRFLVGIIFLFALLLYKFHRRHLSMYEDIEDFIRLHNLIPIRYSYNELKSMTKGFKNKLGQGGFGTVYKGKLRSGSDVAVKILGKSKADGQEFISEVATIGRIHHYNVVHLVGFCIEGVERALVYEFMSKGSLDKYIFSKEDNISLSYHKIYEISLGVARGVAYLHHGCDIQILHFDIKPHNILLDDSFTPKISDFGLARLYAVDDSIVTLTEARGTIGYMAPELFYKNIGGVSYKADVYSFGMLLMEIAGRRRNLNPHAEHSSQLYFPLWIYDQFDETKDLEMEELTEEEKDLAKRMFIIALWCIQLKPVDRPSMNKVIEMLEADSVESLEMPPKPSLYPDERVLMDEDSNSNETTSTSATHSQNDLGEGASEGQ